MISNIKNIASVFELTRRQVKFAGSVLLLLGVAQMGLSVLVAERIIHQREVARKDKADPVSICKKRLDALGLQDSFIKVNPLSKGEIQLSRQTPKDKSGLDDAALRLGEASSVSLMCPGWRMTSLCIGESCGPDNGSETQDSETTNFTMVLKADRKSLEALENKGG